MKTVYAQLWLESERGWGQRSDGTTLHMSVVDAKAFVAKYNATHNNLPEAPDEYTRAEGEPFTVTVTEALYKEVKKQAKVLGMWYEPTKWVKPHQHLKMQK